MRAFFKWLCLIVALIMLAAYGARELVAHRARSFLERIAQANRRYALAHGGKAGSFRQVVAAGLIAEKEVEPPPLGYRLGVDTKSANFMSLSAKNDFLPSFWIEDDWTISATEPKWP